MKKAILLALVLVLCVGLASPAFAANLGTISSITIEAPDKSIKVALTNVADKAVETDGGIHFFLYDNGTLNFSRDVKVYHASSEDQSYAGVIKGGQDYTFEQYSDAIKKLVGVSSDGSWSWSTDSKLDPMNTNSYGNYSATGTVIDISTFAIGTAATSPAPEIKVENVDKLTLQIPGTTGLQITLTDVCSVYYFASSGNLDTYQIFIKPSSTAVFNRDVQLGLNNGGGSDKMVTVKAGETYKNFAAQVAFFDEYPEMTDLVYEYELAVTPDGVFFNPEDARFGDYSGKYTLIKLDTYNWPKTYADIYQAISSLSVNNKADSITETDIPSSWAKESVDKAKTIGLATTDLTNGYQTATTRAEFCRAAVNFLRKYGYDVDGVTPKMFADTSDKNIGIAATLGITSGTDTAKNLFSPNQTLTREQAAAMLRNVMNVIGAKYDTTAVAWTDAKDVSSLAQEAVNVMYNAKIMGGTSTTALVFSPKTSYTHEQSIATLVNLWEYVKNTKTD